MRGLAVALGLAGAALAVTVFVFARIAVFTGDPLTILGQLFLDSDPISKLVLLMLGAVLLVVVVTGAVRLVRRVTTPSDALTTLGYVGPIAGVGAGALTAFNIYAAATRMHVTDIRVVAPSIAEAALVAASGLIVGAFAVALNGSGVRRSRNDA